MAIASYVAFSYQKVTLTMSSNHSAHHAMWLDPVQAMEVHEPVQLPRHNATIRHTASDISIERINLDRVKPIGNIHTLESLDIGESIFCPQPARAVLLFGANAQFGLEIHLQKNGQRLAYYQSRVSLLG